MPNMNGTGPRGEGPMTGRGLGNCNDNNKQSSNNQTGNRPKLGLGCRNGRQGLGRGYRNQNRIA